MFSSILLFYYSLKIWSSEWDENNPKHTWIQQLFMILRKKFPFSTVLRINLSHAYIFTSRESQTTATLKSQRFLMWNAWVEQLKTKLSNKDFQNAIMNQWLDVYCVFIRVFTCSLIEKKIEKKCYMWLVFCLNSSLSFFSRKHFSNNIFFARENVLFSIQFPPSFYVHCSEKLFRYYYH